MMASKRRHPLQKLADDAAARMMEAGADAVFIIGTHSSTDCQRGTFSSWKGNEFTLEGMLSACMPVMWPSLFGDDPDDDEDGPAMPDNGDESDSGDENSA